MQNDAEAQQMGSDCDQTVTDRLTPQRKRKLNQFN